MINQPQKTKTINALKSTPFSRWLSCQHCTPFSYLVEAVKEVVPPALAIQTHRIVQQTQLRRHLEQGRYSTPAVQ